MILHTVFHLHSQLSYNRAIAREIHYFMHACQAKRKNKLRMHHNIFAFYLDFLRAFNTIESTFQVTNILVIASLIELFYNF